MGGTTMSPSRNGIPDDENDPTPVKEGRITNDEKTPSDQTRERGNISAQAPYHVFSRHTKFLLVVIVSVSATLSGLSSNIYFPAMTDVAEALKTSLETVDLSITTYLLAQGIAPSFWGPMADLFGRRSILLCTLTLYMLANVALGLVQNTAMLLIFRAVQAAGSSSTISLGAGIIADIASPQERGGYLGTFSGLRQFSIAIGPVLGGVLAGSLGFRSIFWFLVVLSASVLILIVLMLPETLRRIAGNGSNPSGSIRHQPVLAFILPYTRKSTLLGPFPEWQRSLIEDASNTELNPRKPFRLSIFTQPLGMLIEKDVACALMFGACTYTSWSMMTARTTSYLKEIYGFTTIDVGLAFLANGLGCVSGSILSGRSLNAAFRRESSLWRHYKGLPDYTPIPRPLPVSFPVEQARLAEAPLYSFVQMLGLVIFGWSLTPIGNGYSHWIVPLLAQFAIGYSNTAVLNSNNTLVVDLYPGRSASAGAIVNLTRNLLAAAGVAVAKYITAAVSPGWYGVILAGIVAVGLVPYYVHSMHGQRWRERRTSSSG